MPQEQTQINSFSYIPRNTIIALHQNCELTIFNNRVIIRMGITVEAPKMED